MLFLWASFSPLLKFFTKVGKGTGLATLSTQRGLRETSIKGTSIIRPAGFIKPSGIRISIGKVDAVFYFFLFFQVLRRVNRRKVWMRDTFRQSVEAQVFVNSDTYHPTGLLCGLLPSYLQTVRMWVFHQLNLKVIHLKILVQEECSILTLSPTKK